MTVTPTDWDDVAIADFGEIVGGGTPSRATASYWNGTIPWVTPTGITALREKYIRDTQEKITSDGLASSAARLLPVGSVVVTTRASLGMTAIAAVPLTTNQGFKSIIPNENTESLFAYFCIQTLKPAMVRLSSGTTFLEISKADFSRIRTRRPKPDEQIRIAALLDTFDEAIAKTEAMIAKLRRVRVGLLHDLFTRGLNNEGQLRDPVAHPEQFQDSPFGQIPKDWTPGELADLVPTERPIVYGILMPGRGYRGGVPVIKVKDIRDGRIDLSDLLLTDPRIDEAYKRARVRTGDLLFTIRGTVGRMAFVPAELNGANITQDTARISLQDANPLFVARWLETPIPARFIEVHTIGVAVRGINLGEVRRIPVVVPSKAEQDAIASIIATAEEQIDAELGVLEVLLNIKSGLMTDLLTGRVRVPETK